MAAVDGGQAEPTAVPDHVYINPIRADRADDFETWLRSVVVPAARALQPHTIGRWRVLRAEAEEDTVVFVFLFYGGQEDDWDLQALLVQALGPEKAQQELTELDGMYRGDQYGWTFAPVAGIS